MRKNQLQSLRYIAAAGYIYGYQWRECLPLSIRGLVDIGDRDEDDGAIISITERGKQYMQNHKS